MIVDILIFVSVYISFNDLMTKYIGNVRSVETALFNVLT